MEKKYKGTGGRVRGFFKKNVYYILIALCVMAVIAMITVAAVASSRGGEVPPVSTTPDPPVVEIPDPDPTDPTEPIVQPDPFILAMPVSGATLGLGYDENWVEHTAGYRHFASHLGMDFMADVGSAVVASFNGRVLAIDTDNEPLEGAVITIEHADGFVTVYKMLRVADVQVTVGQQVESGQTIGFIGDVMSQEGVAGSKVHFELHQNNMDVNPAMYFSEGDK